MTFSEVSSEQIKGLEKMLLWCPPEHTGRIVQLINKIKKEQAEELKCPIK